MRLKIKAGIGRPVELAAVLAALGLAGSVDAHHSNSMFDVSMPIWVRGTVVRYEPIAPHAIIYLEETTADGQVQRWRIEGPWPTRLGWILENNGIVDGRDFFMPGDVIEVCGFDFRAEVKAQRDPNAPVPEGKFAHGQMVVMPDGHRQSWGGYGKIDNCVRPDDSIETWVDFLNADPLARNIWCGNINNRSAAAIAPREFVDAVSREIDRPCDQP
jgi:hypothetical protein